MAAKNYKVEIIVAIIALISALGVAIITNWDKLFPPKPGLDNKAFVEKLPNPEKSAKNLPENPAEKPPDSAQAEKMVSEWVAGTLSKDIDKLVVLADTPFYFDNEILVRREDIRRKYENAFSNSRQPQNEEKWQLKSLKVKTIAQLRSEGYEERRDRILNSLRLNDDDYVGICVFSREGQESQEGTLVFLRKVGNNLKIAGFWN